MFGCPAYFVNNNMFTCVHQDNIILRLSKDDRKKIKNEFDEATPFEPMTGRVMKEYISVPEALYSDAETFDSWLKRSFDYASKLPQKKSKGRKK